MQTQSNDVFLNYMSCNLENIQKTFRILSNFMMGEIQMDDRAHVPREEASQSIGSN